MNKKSFNKSEPKNTAFKGVRPKGTSQSDVSDNTQGKNSKGGNKGQNKIILQIKSQTKKLIIQNQMPRKVGIVPIVKPKRIAQTIVSIWRAVNILRVNLSRNKLINEMIAVLAMTVRRTKIMILVLVILTLYVLSTTNLL